MKKNSNLSETESHHPKPGGRARKKTAASAVETDTRSLVHELETQAEEMTQAQAEVEAAYRQYTDLYDFAPVGYFTLGYDGTTRKVNLAGANLIGVERHKLINQQLGIFVSDESRPAFNNFLEKLLSGYGKETSEVAFLKNGDELVWVRIEASCFEGGQESRAVMMDISERHRMEQALQESEKRFRTTLQDVPTVAVQGYGMDGTTQYWNLASERLYGYSAQEAIGRNLLDLIIPPEMRDAVWQAIQQMAATGQPIPAAELSMMRKDGSLVPVFSSHSIASSLGRPLELFCLDIDLTERKRVEKALQNATEQLELAQISAGVGVWDWNIIDGSIKWTTKMFELFGLDQDKEAASFETWRRVLHPEDASAAEAQIFQALQDHVELRNEYRIIWPDGQVKWINTIGRGVYGAEGQSLRMLGICVDITERKQVEEALMRSERKYRLLHESMIDGFVTVNMGGNFLEFNEVYRNMLGYSEAELAQLTYVDITPEKWHVFEADILENQILKRGYSDIYEKEYIRKDGTVFPVELRTVLLCDEQERPVGMWAIVRDITERKQAEKTLRENQELFSLFMRHSPIYTFIKEVTPTESRVLQASENYQEMIGIKGKDMVGKAMAELFPPEFAAKITADDWAVVSNGETLKLDEELNGRNYISIKFPIIQGDKTLLAGYTIDITERVQVEDELRHARELLTAVNIELQTALIREKQLAHTDVLTGVNNRRYLFELGEHEFEVAGRYQKPLSVVMFDIDHFKNVNDTFGHTVGDQILELVAQVACAELRSADVIGRYGGEEFVLILPMTEAQQAYQLAERIRAGVTAIRVPTPKGVATVTLSIGIVEMIHSSQTESIEDLIRRSDEAMYAAKQAGRNRTEIRS